MAYVDQDPPTLDEAVAFGMRVLKLTLKSKAGGDLAQSLVAELRRLLAGDPLRLGRLEQELEELGIREG